MKLQTLKGRSARLDNFLLLRKMLSANPVFPEDGNCTEQLFSSGFWGDIFVRKTRSSLRVMFKSLGDILDI